MAFRPPSRRLLWVLFSLVLLLSAALRLLGLIHVPAGLSHDEAYNGVTALEVLLQGRRDVFFDIYNGIEPLVIYWEALNFHLFGVSVWSMRLVNVVSGMLTVSIGAAIAGRLWRHDVWPCNRWLSVLTASGVSTSLWAVFISRLALRAVMLPVASGVALYCLWRGFSGDPRQRRSLLWFPAAGLALGAAMYTYLSARFLPLAPLLFFAWWVVRRQARRRDWLGMAILVLTTTAVMSPLACLLHKHPPVVVQRAGQVLTLPAALAGDFRPMFTSIGRTLAAFGFLGPSSSRYGLAGTPLFEPMGAILFWLGLGVSLWRLRRPAWQAAPYALVIAWWLAMLVPSFITSESPHYLRMVGALIPTYILWALGLAICAHRLVRNRPAWRIPAAMGVGAYLLCVLALTVWSYFGRWADDADARQIYGAEFTELAETLENRTTDTFPAISSAYFRDWDRFRLDLQTGHHPPFAIWFHGPETLLLPPEASDLDPRYYFLASAPAHPRWQDFLKLETMGRDLTVYRLQPDAVVKLPNPLDAVFGAPLDDGESPLPVARAVGYELAGPAQAGTVLPILLHWTSLCDLPSTPDYAFFAHLRDDQGFTWAQVDSNGYDAADWQPGVQVLQWLALDLPPDLPPITYTLHVGLEDRAAGRPLLALQPDGVEGSLGLRSLVPVPADPPPTADTYPVPNPLNEVAGGGLVLQGYSVNPTWVPAGQATNVSLFWQATSAPSADYTLVVWLETETGETVAMLRRAPLAGEYPTRRWQAGQWVRDRFVLTAPADALGQVGNLCVGWQDANGAWLPGDEPPGVCLTQVFFAE